LFAVEWRGVFGVASTQSFSSFGSMINFTSELANVHHAYSNGVFTARAAGQYYVELCAGAEV